MGKGHRKISTLPLPPNTSIFTKNTASLWSLGSTVSSLPYLVESPIGEDHAVLGLHGVQMSGAPDASHRQRHLPPLRRVQRHPRHTVGEPDTSAAATVDGTVK